MKISCPSTCAALQHPEAGFYIKRLMAGESIKLEQSASNSIIFLMYGSLEVDSEECNNYALEERHMILCYKGYNYTLTAKSNTEFIVAHFTALGGACDISMLTKLFKRGCCLQ